MRSNEEELDLFADLVEPASEIIGDKDVADIVTSGGKLASAVKVAIKNHKAAVIEILARIDGVPVEKYHVTALSLPVKLIRLFNDPMVKDLFTLQTQDDAASSGSAMENIEGGAV